MFIRKALSKDLDNVSSLVRAAFSSNEEENLVRNLLEDTSAKPSISLIAFKNDLPVGYILFTNGRLEPKTSLSIKILAPLAVDPNFQKQGIGGKLIKHGFQLLKQLEIDLVFVLGYPGYYSRYGFNPAGNLGFDAPYPISKRNANAWMVYKICPERIGAFSSRKKVICSDKLNQAKYWRE